MLPGKEQKMPVKEISGKLNGKGIKIGLVVSRFNEFFTKQLLGGAVDCLVRHGTDEKDITVAWVPGANEIPLAVLNMAKSGKYDTIVAVGAVIRGATTHADLINSQVSKSLVKISMDTGMPVINGVISAENLEQAVERSGTKAGNKGADAAIAAIEMVNLSKEM